jgi:hypothetical protein
MIKTQRKNVCRSTTIYYSFFFPYFPQVTTLMEIPQGNTMENSGKQNPEMRFKSPPSTWIKSIPVLSGLYLDTYDNTSFYVKNVIR